MRIAFSCPVAPGHMLPMLALARRVQERGHDVFFLNLLDSEAAIRASGVAFEPFCETAYPLGEVPRQLRKLSTLTGVEALAYTVSLFTDFCRTALEDGPRALEATRPDALVLDGSQRGLNMVALARKLPFIHVYNALQFDFSGDAPLCFFDWPYEDTPEARLRNQHGIALFAQLLGPLIELQSTYAAQAHLELNCADPRAGLSTIAQIAQTPKEFDFPGGHWPAHFYYAGPFHDAGLRPPVDFPWERLTGEPLIYASMGTLQNGSETVFRIIAEGASAPGRQLVLSVGNNLDPAQIGPLSPTTIVVTQAPQLELLKRATLSITHAGLNTALESLAQGVPMVAIPITNDQPGVGARIAYTGTGVVLQLSTLTPESVRAAVDKVLGDPSYRTNAQRLQRAIQETKGLDLAASLVDQKLREAVKPVAAAAV